MMTSSPCTNATANAGPDPVATQSTSPLIDLRHFYSQSIGPEVPLLAKLCDREPLRFWLRDQALHGGASHALASLRTLIFEAKSGVEHGSLEGERKLFVELLLAELAANDELIRTISELSTTEATYRLPPSYGDDEQAGGERSLIDLYPEDLVF